MTSEPDTSAPASASVLRFRQYRYDRDTGVLYRNGEPVAVQPKVLEVLECLLIRRGEVVSKEELLDRVWDDAVVTEHSLTEAVRRLRETLDDDPADPSYVETVRGRGYRFVAPVSEEGEASAPSDREAEGRAGPGGAGTLGRISDRLRIRQHPVLWTVLALVAAISVVAAGMTRWANRYSTREEPVYSFRFEVGTEPSPRREFGHSLVLSPDGSRLAVVAGEDLDTSLYVRPMDRFEATRIPGTEGAMDPFFSPDGRWIGFFTLDALKKVAVGGGAPTTLTEFEDSSSLTGGASWNTDGTIVFATSDGIARIPASGGEPERIVHSDPKEGPVDYRWPQVLPGGNAVLLTGESSRESGPDVMVASLETGKVRTILRGGMDARYVPSGHLLYVDERTLHAAPFDPDRRELTGQPVPVLENLVAHQIFRSAQYSVSENGTLVYLAGGASAFSNTINWARRDGTVSRAFDEAGIYRTPALSPDGKRLAVSVATSRGSDIWVGDLERGTMSKLTFDGAGNGFPTWSPDGRWLAYFANSAGKGSEIRVKRADGTGEATTVHRSETSDAPADWSPDGRTLAVVADFTGQRDLHLLRLPDGFGEGDPPDPVDTEPFVVSELTEELQPTFSPDGRWIAYVSDESGRYEIYVRSYPVPAGKWQITNDGAWYPVWSIDGGELFYLDDDRIIAVPYTVPGDRFSAGEPETAVTLPESPAFSAPAPLLSGFDVAPDDRRFVVLQRNPARLEESVRPTIVLNWFEELKRRVPPGQ